MSTVQIIKHQPEDQNAKCSQPRNCNNKLKFAFGSIVILILVAMVATVCAVVVVFSLSRSGKALPDQTTQLTITGLEEKAKMLDKLVGSHKTEKERVSRRAERREGSRSRLMESSCYSLMTNDSYPAAHITGIMSRWKQKNMFTPTHENPDPTVADANGYQSHWMCSGRRGAFVDGGMYFNQTDKKLYVPKGGYYYISSQMYYSFITNEGNQFVMHRLTVERNCGIDYDDLHLESLSSLGPLNKMSQSSTYLGDVVQICAGGKISMNVPVNANRPCCPVGMDTITYFSAYLVKEMKYESNKTRMLQTPPTQQDYDHYYNTQ